MSTTIQSSPSFFKPDYLKHVIEHMNSDHADAILNYVKHFGGVADAQSARLDHLDQKGMDITYLLSNKEQKQIRVDYPAPLTVQEEAHKVLVAMAKAANPEGKQSENLLNRAREALQQLQQQQKTVILSTFSPESEPDASVAPAVVENNRFYIYVSEISAHTRNMENSGKAGVFLIEDENLADNLLARKRASFGCTVSLVERDSEDFKRIMEQMKERFGPVMKHLEQLIDFKMLQLTPTKGRLVSGFAQAYDIDPENWDRLSHVSAGGGHTRAPKK